MRYLRSQNIFWNQRFLNKIFLEPVFGKSLNAIKEQALTNDYDMTATTALLNKHRKITVQVTLEETAGYTMLGIFAVHFADILSGELKGEYKYHPQLQVANNRKSGQNPSADTAILVLFAAKYLIPTVMYKYKPTIHPDLSRVDVLPMMEMLLQAHYCMRYYNLQVVLHCLTDLKTWHYFPKQKNINTYY